MLKGILVGLDHAIHLHGEALAPPFDRRDLLLKPTDWATLRLNLIILVGVIQLLEILRHALVTLGHRHGELGFGEVALPAVHGLDPRAVNRDQLTSEQIELPAQHHKFPEYLTKRRPVVAPEIRDRLEVWRQAAQQPDHFEIAPRFDLQAAAGTHPIEVAIDVKLQEVGRSVSRSTGGLRLDATKTSGSQIETIDECVNRPDDVVRPYIVVHRLRQEQKLGPIIP